MIRNFDSNGLVFALHPTIVKEDFTSVSYQQAILNILDAQKFHCIPLVDSLIERENTNNLRDRAVYKEGGGEVTHIARKPRYENEPPVVFIPIEQITHVGEDIDLIDAVIQLFSHKDNDVCNFIISVGGTPKFPTALFTLRELLLDKTRNELFLRMAKKGIESSDSDLTKYSYLIYTQLTELDKNQNWNDVKGVASKIISELAKIPKSVDHHGSRKSDLIDSGDFSDLRVKDIMTSAACGIEINTEDKTLNLARRMLCLANDFDRLVVYQNGKLNPEKVVVNSKQDPAKSITAKTEDSIRSVIKKCRDIRSKDVYAIVEPDKNIITGEGPMTWPGILTIKELRSAKALLSYAATCGMIELQMVKYMAAHGIDQIRVRRGKEFVDKPIEKATMGEIVGFLRPNNGQDLYAVFDVFKNQITIDELGDFVDIRNEIIHESLVACFGKRINPEKINIRNLKIIYKIAECLKIYN